MVGGEDNNAEATEILNLNDQESGWTLLEGPNKKIGYASMNAVALNNNIFVFGKSFQHVHCTVNRNI